MDRTITERTYLLSKLKAEEWRYSNNMVNSQKKRGQKKLCANLAGIWYSRNAEEDEFAPPTAVDESELS